MKPHKIDSYFNLAALVARGLAKGLPVEAVGFAREKKKDKAQLDRMRMGESCFKAGNRTPHFGIR
jgi:hypothetical protein